MEQDINNEKINKQATETKKFGITPQNDFFDIRWRKVELNN